MADMITYFTRNDAMSAAEGMDVYEFTGNAVNFVQDCIDRFREAYISENKINRLQSPTNTRRNIIARRLPTLNRIKAGDFGEILSYYLWTETWGADATIKPFKWRWKENPDIPSHLVDVILLKRVDSSRSDPNDKMYTVESKVYTSPKKKNHSSLTDALDGALTDEAERAAKAISYLVIQYERDDETELSELVKRFGDPVNGPYQKIHSAIAIVDSAQAAHHLGNFDRNMKSSNPQIPIYFLPFNDLKQVYIDIYDKLPNS